MDEQNNSAEVVRDLAIAADKPDLIEIPEAPSIRVVKEARPNDGTFAYRVLELEKYALSPDRIREKIDFQDATTFVDYVNAFKNASSRIFFDSDAVQFVAVLDYCGSDAQWGEHIASLKLRNSEEWKLWFGRNGTQYGQREFGRFIEDNQIDIVSPSGTDLFEMVMTFTATKNLQFQEANKLQNGQTELVWKEDVKTGSTTIPYKMQISIPVFFNEAPDLVDLFLRYSIDDSAKALKLGIEFCRPGRVQSEAARKIVDRVHTETQLPVHFGKRLTAR